ncbi:MAG TPA: hypothetical protein VK689_07750, partial [Armatimonadota bacterium]|nr:hypothetical protein [Armatimonadota bacterium]
EIIVYVLGASLADDARDERTVGNSIKVKPMRYDTLLQRANSRTFNLQARIEAVRPLVGHDPEVEHVLAQAAQQPELDIQEP